MISPVCRLTQRPASSTGPPNGERAHKREAPGPEPTEVRRVRGAFYGPVLDKPLGNLRSNQAKQDRDHEEQPFRSLIPRVRLFRLGRVRLGIVLLMRLHAPSYTKQAPLKPRTRPRRGPLLPLASAGGKDATRKASPTDQRRHSTFVNRFRASRRPQRA